jgi:hypothetical protein
MEQVLSYRCKVCMVVRPPRTQMLRHILYRPDRSIKAELAVCAGCYEAIRNGLPLPSPVKTVAPVSDPEEFLMGPVTKGNSKGPAVPYVPRPFAGGRSAQVPYGGG